MRSEPFVFKKSNSRFWKLRYYDNGRPKTISTKKETETDANDWAKSFLKDPEQSDKLKEPILFKTFVDNVFIPSKTLDVRTVSTMRSVANVFCNTVPEKFVHQYTKEDINLFINDRTGKISEHTLKSYTVNLNVIFNYALSDNYIKINPVLKSKPVRPKEPKIIYFTGKDFDKLISVMDNQLIKDITYFAVYTGMRASEILRLKKEDINLRNKTLLNYQKKVDKYNNISIAGDIFEIVKRNYKQNSEYLFVYEFRKTKITVVELSKRFKEFVKKASLPDYYCFKSLRKTFGSILWQKKVPLDRVSKLLGHGDTRITKKHYAQLNDDFDNTVNLIGLKGKK